MTNLIADSLIAPVALVLPQLTDQRIHHKVDECMMPDEQTYKVKPIVPNIIGWLGTIFFLFATITAFYSGKHVVSCSFMAFVSLGVFVILTAGELRLSREEIVSVTPIAKFQMKWEEVREIELDPKGGNLVFYAAGRRRRIAVLGPLYWYGAKKRNMTQLISEKIQQHHIPVRQTSRAAYVLSKNTRCT